MKKLLLIVLTLGLVAGLLTAQAGQTPFANDVAAINKAAGSVLMLLVYDGDTGSMSRTGSGFVAFDSRTLVTSYRLVAGGSLVLAEDEAGHAHFLDQVIAADPEKDLVILRFKGDSGLPPLPIRQSVSPARGEPVLIISNLDNQGSNSLLKGDITSLRTVEGTSHIHFSAPAAPAPGSALLNQEGLLIGLVTAKEVNSPTQMHEALDIWEAVSLMQAAEGSLTPLSKLGFDAPAAQGEPQVADYTIRNLTAREETPGQVVLTWESDAPEGTEYYLAYEVKDNNNHSFLTTTEKTTAIYPLVPGEEYEFYVSPNIPSLWDELKQSTSLALAAPLAFTQGEDLLLSLGLYLQLENHPFRNYLPGSLDSITVGELHQALHDTVLNMTSAIRLAQDTVHPTRTGFYTLHTPAGYVYITNLFDIPFNQKLLVNYNHSNMAELLLDVKEFEGGFEPGTWVFAAYMDDGLVGEVEIKVVAEEELPLSQAAPARQRQLYDLLPEVIPLKVGEEAYVGSPFRPTINPDIINADPLRAITRFTLAYLGESRDMMPLDFGDSGQQLTYYTYDLRVEPGALVNPGEISLRRYGPDIYYVYVAVSEITFEDGTVLT
ncbi:MAG: hypothetical protein GXZ04_04490, partial [Clostridiales bacterium]|nr:hypothetical protein [Clostridiales bacterium]